MAAAEPGGAEEWETAKENFVPVKQGRAAAALATPLSVRKRSDELEAARRAFVGAIESADDPLPAWLRYIKHTQEQCAAQGSKAELTRVLEAATKALSADGRYSDDVRLLRIWVQYADCLPDPSDVFLFLEDRRIGRGHALAYEAHATYLELRGAFGQAGLVYEEGVRRLAKPLDRLKAKHAAFQQRMDKRLARQTSEAALGMGDASDAAARTTLAPMQPLEAAALDENGQLRQPGARHAQRRVAQPQAAPSVAAGVRPAPAAGGGRASMWALPGVAQQPLPPPAASRGPVQNLLGSFGAAAGSSSHHGGAGPGSSSSSANAAPAPLAVHVDDEFGPRGRGSVPAAFPPSLQQHGALPGLAAATKENSSQPGSWVGAKVRQQALHAGPPAARLEVYDDDEGSEEGASELGHAAATAPAPGQQQRTGPRQQLDALDARHGGATGAQAAQQGAVALRPLAPSLGAASSQQASSSGGSSRAAGAAARPAPAGPHGFSEALLVGPGGTELSFEEVRAAAWRRRHQQQQQQEQQQPPQQDQRQRAPAVQQPLQAREQVPAAQQPLPQARQQVPAQAAAQQPLPQAPRQAAAPAAAEPTVTINTRAALEAMNGMFSADLPTATLPRGAVAFAASAAARDAGAARQQRQQPPPQQQQPGRRGAPEPTVTINTRAALEAMNGMFGRPDDTATMHGLGRVGVGAPAAAAARQGEPTVTINTRAALDYMNGVFGGAGDVTMGATLGLGARAGRGGRASMAAAGRASLAPGGGLGLYEDTELLTAGVQARLGGGDLPPDQEQEQELGVGGLLGVYEDTEFVGSRLAAAAAAGGRRRSSMAAAGRSGSGSSGAGGGGGLGLGLYEDTEFITRAVNGGGAAAGAAAAAAGHDGGLGGPSSSGGGLGLYEDTEFITRPVGQAGGVSAGGGGLTRGLDRLSLANAGRSRSGGGGLRDSGDAGPADAGGGGLGLGLYEDTEFITRAVGPAGPAHDSSGAGLGLYADTEFLEHAGGAASGSGCSAGPGAARQHARPPAAGRQQHDDDSTAGVKENVPAGGRRPRTGGGTLGGGGSSLGAAAQQQQPQQHCGAGPSRFGPGGGSSLPSSPGASAKAPSGAATPSRPPRTPGTPGAGPWARQLEEFEVLDSPAVRAALAARPPAGCSSACSSPGMPSPGLGARENWPAAAHAKDAPALPPRSLADRAVRAAALQPLAARRAELLGVQIDPSGAAGGACDEGGEPDEGGAPSPALGTKKALRALPFSTRRGE